MDVKSYKLAKNYTDKEITKIINNQTPIDAMARQAATDAYGVDHENLKERLDAEQLSVNVQLAEKASQIDLTNAVSPKADKSYVDTELGKKANSSDLVPKADKVYVDTQIQSVASGAPKGVYATLTDLQTAFPTGNTNIYVITADGKWYYWSGSAWTAGGTYQATSLADNSVTSLKKTVLGEEAYLYTTSPVNVDFVGGKIDIPSGTKFVIWRNKSFTLTTSAISIPKSGSTLAGSLVFNTLTNTVELLTTASVTENHVSLGYIHTTVRVLNFAYTVDGKADIYGSFDSTKLSPLGSSAFLASRDIIKIDKTNKKLGLNKNNPFNFVFYQKTSKAVDLSEYTADVTGYIYIPLITNGYLYFNTVTNKLISGTLSSMDSNCLLLGFIDTDLLTNGTYLFSSPYTIDGKVNLPSNSITQEMLSGVNLSVTSKWKGKKFVAFGDSITWYDGNTFVNTHIQYGTVAKGYQSYMREKLECTVDNQGYSGAIMKQIFDSKIAPYDFTSVDAVTLTSGANDHRRAIPIGTVGAAGGTYNKDTFAGAMQTAIEHILNAKPTIQIYLITPIKGWYHESGTSDVPGPYNNEMIISMDYVNAIKQLGELYSLPVCDWYYLSGISEATKDIYIGDNDAVFTAYDLHPTNDGYGRMANVLIPFLNNY